MRDRSQFVRDTTARSRLPIDQLDVDRLLHGHCRYCSAEIVFVPSVGWIAPHLDDDSGSCASSKLGRHKPVVRTSRR